MKYNFQDYLSLEIVSNGKRQYDRYFENEYARIDAEKVGGSVPEYSATLQVVDKLNGAHTKDAIVRTVRFKSLFTFKYSIVGFGTKNVVIYFQDHWVSRVYVTAVGVFMQGQVLEPVLYHCFLQQDVILMHSAGVSKDGLAYVFPAYGGTGKTTTSMSLLEKGYDFLGDDLLIVDPDKRMVFPYPRPLHIFTYNVRSLSGARIPKFTTFVIYFKNVLRYILETILGEEFLIATRIHADQIFPNFRISSPAKLHNVIFLKKEGDHETPDLGSQKAIDDHATKIIKSADLNLSLFDILSDEKLEKDIEKMELRVVTQVLKNINHFSYLNTRMIKLDDIETYLGDT